MKGPWIAAGIVAVIVFLLFCPIQLRLAYQNTFSAELRWLFLRFRLTDRPPKPAKATKKPGKAKPKPQPSVWQQLKEWEASLGASSLPEALSKLTAILKAALNKTAWLLKHSTLSRLELTVLVGGEDAADTAMTYGTVCAVVYPLLSFGTGLFRRVKRQQTDVRCCFDRTDSAAKGVVWIRVTPLGVLRAAIGLVWAFVKMQKKAESKEVTAL